MSEPTQRVRPSIKALVIEDDRLLVTANTGETDHFYLLPGGGQEWGESMVETLHRECLEEVSTRVVVGDLACVRDYIGARHEFAEWDAHFHQIELIFWCQREPGQDEPHVGSVADDFQTGVVWLPLSELDDAPLYPAELKSWLKTDPATRPTYLGPVN